MKTKKTLEIVRSIMYALLIVNFALLTFNSFAQGGASINTSGTAADNSAMLDVSATNQGILIPRVALTDTSLASPVSSPANSLLVYNTATFTGGNPGFYFWDATHTQWVSVLSSNTGWLLTGNTATTAGTNFIGSTDANDVIIKSKNNEILRVKTDSNVVFTGQTYTPKYIIP